MKRKNLIVAVVIMLFAASYANAQKFKFGPVVGGNISWLTASPYDRDFISKPGIEIGGMAVYNFSSSRKGLFVEADLQIASRRSRGEVSYYESNGTSTTYINDFRLTYLQVPVIVGYKLPLSGKLSTYLGAGLMVGFGLSATDDYSIIRQDNAKEFVNSYDPFKGGTANKADFSGNVRLGLEYDSRYGMQIGYRAVLNDAYSDHIPNTITFKNYSVNLSFYYLF